MNTEMNTEMVSRMNTEMNTAESTTTTTTTIGEHEDVHVEIEHIPEDTVGSLDSDGDHTDCSPNALGNHNAVTHFNNSKVHMYTRVQGRRTVILPHQRKILEDFYNTGMISASHNLHHLHEAAAEQTGLELYVIKNWVRNRRRPSAAQKRQDVNNEVHISSPQSLMSTIPLTTNNVTTVTIPTPLSLHHHHQPHHLPPPTLVLPESKRHCIDHGLINNDINKPFLVKVRIADSGESDFVEVDVHGTSYNELLRSCCEELEVSLEEVSKLRKLPNVLIRKDKDVARLDNGQELELVLTRGNSSMPLMAAINPFSANSSVHLIPLINTDNSLLSLDNSGTTTTTQSNSSGEGGTNHNNNTNHHIS